MDCEVKTFEGELVEQLSLSEAVFGLIPRKDILQRVVCWQLARRRQGTHCVQGRSGVSRTGAKMYKQKGTGRARHSSARAPQFRGGGKAHGPIFRSHAYDLPKKIRSLGLKHALSAKMRSQNLILVDDLSFIGKKTRILVKHLAKFDLDNALLIGGRGLDVNFCRAASNIPNVDVLPVQGINVYDILRRSKLVLSRAAVLLLEERLK